MSIYDEDVSYKLFMTSDGPEVIPIQYFDEHDYDQHKFISSDFFETEESANDTLDELRISVYGSYPEMDNIDRNLLLALYKKSYKTLKNSEISETLDNTMTRINDELDLTSFEVIRIRRILSSAFLSIKSDE